MSSWTLNIVNNNQSDNTQITPEKLCRRSPCLVLTLEWPNLIDIFIKTSLHNALSQKFNIAAIYLSNVPWIIFAKLCGRILCLMLALKSHNPISTSGSY